MLIKHNSLTILDGLSLAMFEAFRGLRDAVAPESGNLGGNDASADGAASEQPDMDEMWLLYKAGDAGMIDMMKRASSSGGENVSLPQKREDFVRLHAKMEMEKDRELVFSLASTVLKKSAEIDERVDSLPGMERTRTEQMKYMEELIESNRQAADDLERVYATARERRDACRKFVLEKTSEALAIDEELDQDDD